MPDKNDSKWEFDAPKFWDFTGALKMKPPSDSWFSEKTVSGPSFPEPSTSSNHLKKKRLLNSETAEYSNTKKQYSEKKQKLSGDVFSRLSSTKTMASANKVKTSKATDHKAGLYRDRKMMDTNNKKELTSTTTPQNKKSHIILPDITTSKISKESSSDNTSLNNSIQKKPAFKLPSKYLLQTPPEQIRSSVYDFDTSPLPSPEQTRPPMYESQPLHFEKPQNDLLDIPLKDVNPNHSPVIQGNNSSKWKFGPPKTSDFFGVLQEKTTSDSWLDEDDISRNSFTGPSALFKSPKRTSLLHLKTSENQSTTELSSEKKRKMSNDVFSKLSSSKAVTSTSKSNTYKSANEDSEIHRVDKSLNTSKTINRQSIIHHPKEPTIANKIENKQLKIHKATKQPNIHKAADEQPKIYHVSELPNTYKAANEQSIKHNSKIISTTEKTTDDQPKTLDALKHSSIHKPTKDQPKMQDVSNLSSTNDQFKTHHIEESSSMHKATNEQIMLRRARELSITYDFANERPTVKRARELIRTLNITPKQPVIDHFWKPLSSYKSFNDWPAVEYAKKLLDTLADKGVISSTNFLLYKEPHVILHETKQSKPFN